MSSPINILIVEDESIVALNLAAGLQNEGYNIIGIADNSVDAKELFTSGSVDILLMDINILGDKDGIDTANELLKIKKVPVIYLTAFTDVITVTRVKTTHPAAFLTKPYSMSNVRIAIELAISNFVEAIGNEPPQKITSKEKADTKDEQAIPTNELLLQMDNFIFIKQNYKFLKVCISDILYTESDNNYIHLVTSERKYTLRMSLQQFQDKLNYKKFIRVHRSFLVNMPAVQSFSETEVQVKNFELPISRTYREDFVKQFQS